MARECHAHPHRRRHTPHSASWCCSGATGWGPSRTPIQVSHTTVGVGGVPGRYFHGTYTTLWAWGVSEVNLTGGSGSSKVSTSVIDLHIFPPSSYCDPAELKEACVSVACCVKEARMFRENEDVVNGGIRFKVSSTSAVETDRNAWKPQDVTAIVKKFLEANDHGNYMNEKRRDRLEKAVKESLRNSNVKLPAKLRTDTAVKFYYSRKEGLKGEGLPNFILKVDTEVVGGENK
ncbi:hypothetical protein BJ508DRAFT_313942 [Ascobolus immersus RN42]|uniref:Uncharacterized protein n=1 Tax=Ascobolus immersus RN42 TaxID=1160509 RepID=A0A3N4HLB5_ASCIM|nr:hypothetical protein BJ508DRAFT_313942 [Ascobolus immersus RN42]